MGDVGDIIRRAADSGREPNVKGVFLCQTCDVRVRYAYSDRQAKTVEWVCPEGHRSKLEETVI